MTKFITLKEVSNIVGLKKSAIYSRISEGIFPGPIKIGTHCSRWNSTEIQNWVEKAVEDRHAG